MKYFIDTEFIEDGIILDLISLAIVSEFHFGVSDKETDMGHEIKL